MIPHFLFVFLLAGLSAPTLAQRCPTPQGWAKPARHVAARTPDLRFALQPNTTAQLQLHKEPSVAVPINKKRATHAGEFAGLAALNVVKAGKLEVALSDRAYVDLVRLGRPLQSTAHQRRQCNGMFKTVTFDVTPGRYVVQIAHAKARSIRVGFRTL